jgi:hypothetical protein
LAVVAVAVVVVDHSRAAEVKTAAVVLAVAARV